MEWSEKTAIVKLLSHAILALGEGSNTFVHVSHASVFSHWPRLYYALYVHEAYSAHAYTYLHVVQYVSCKDKCKKCVLLGEMSSQDQMSLVKDLEGTVFWLLGDTMMDMSVTSGI